jgi:hypothetical protein
VPSEPGRYVIATGNQGNAGLVLTLPVGTHLANNSPVSGRPDARPPKKGDVMWCFMGANAVGTLPQGVTDTAGAQWITVANIPGGTGPGQTNQPLGAWLAIAPRDYTTADVITPAFANNNNQRVATIKGSAGLGRGPLAVVAVGVPAGTGLAVDTGPGPPVQDPALLISGQVNGGGAGIPSGLLFGDSAKLAFQAAANQWQTTTEEFTTAPVAALRQSGTIASSQTWAVIAFALSVLLPMSVWDGADWLGVAATGAKVWTGSKWLEVQ